MHNREPIYKYLITKYLLLESDHKNFLDRTVNIYIYIYNIFPLLAVWTQTWMSANLQQGFPNWDFYMDLLLLKNRILHLINK